MRYGTILYSSAFRVEQIRQRKVGFSTFSVWVTYPKDEFPGRHVKNVPVDYGVRLHTVAFKWWCWPWKHSSEKFVSFFCSPASCLNLIRGWWAIKIQRLRKGSSWGRARLPSLLRSLIAISLPSRSLRSNRGITLSIPRIKTNTGARAFSSCAPSLWNNLPLSVRSATSVATFRRRLKTYLFDLAFPP